MKRSDRSQKFPDEKRGNHVSNDQLEKAMRSAKASIEMEGLVVTEEQETLVRKRLMGELTEEEFLKEALKMVTGDEK